MALPLAGDRNAAEIAYWNGPGGQRWLSHQRSQDALLERARQLAPSGLPLEFAFADATVYGFEPGSADLLFSRFGVMFFTDPPRAFANMRRGLRSEGRMVFACRREARHNPWLMLPLQAAYRHVPRLPEHSPEDPGPFSFASETRVREVLVRAGWSDAKLEPVDLSFDLAESRGLDRAVEMSLGIGPASRAHSVSLSGRAAVDDAPRTSARRRV